MIVKLDYNENDKGILIDYLNETDADFGVPLSQKIDFASFAEKILSKGHVYMVSEDNTYCAMICFYCNDIIEKKAYLPILSTKACARGKGYARLLIMQMINICSLYKMKHILCDSINPIAISIYKSFGFKTYKETCDNGIRKEYLIKDIAEISSQTIVDFLQQIDNDYTPSLSTKISLQDYSEKIKTLGHVIIDPCKDFIHGIAVIYCNDSETQKAYIPLVGVSKEFSGQGVAKRIVKELIYFAKYKNFKVIGIHSNKSVSIKIYQSLGFVVVGNPQDGRYYMELEIN